jgi:hypothetical protein
VNDVGDFVADDLARRLGPKCALRRRRPSQDHENENKNADNSSVSTASSNLSFDERLAQRRSKARLPNENANVKKTTTNQITRKAARATTKGNHSKGGGEKNSKREVKCDIDDAAADAARNAVFPTEVLCDAVGFLFPMQHSLAKRVCQGEAMLLAAALALQPAAFNGYWEKRFCFVLLFGLLLLAHQLCLAARPSFPRAWSLLTGGGWLLASVCVAYRPFSPFEEPPAHAIVSAVNTTLLALLLRGALSASLEK